MKRTTFQPTGIKIVVPIENVNPRKRLGPETKLMDLGWAIRNGMVRIVTDANQIAALDGRHTTKSADRTKRHAAHNPNVQAHYVLKKMPPKERVQPQVLTILQTLNELGGTASRDELLKALKSKLRSKQSPSTVFSLKRKAMLDGGWIKIAS